MKEQHHSVLQTKRFTRFLLSISIALLLVLAILYLPCKVKVQDGQLLVFHDDEEFFPFYNYVIIEDKDQNANTKKKVNLYPSMEFRETREDVQPTEIKKVRNWKIQPALKEAELQHLKKPITTKETNLNTNKTYDFVEEMPEFPGGEKALLAFIYQEIEYPEFYKLDGLQGEVMVQFVVSETGKVEQVELLLEDAPGFNKEAIRVISNLPDWIPGRQDSTPVKVRRAIPIEFRISE